MYDQVSDGSCWKLVENFTKKLQELEIINLISFTPQGALLA
jgi:hypothetical protein